MSRSTAMILAMALVALGRLHPAAQTQAPAASATPKMPVNVQVLKGLTLKEVRAEMDIVAASLGVKCENCHIKGNFPADTKEDKPIARKMLAMTKDINNAIRGAVQRRREESEQARQGHLLHVSQRREGTEERSSRHCGQPIAGIIISYWPCSPRWTAVQRARACLRRPASWH